MEKYNLDEKGGLFKFVEKRASKVIKKGDDIELKHFNNPSNIMSSVIDVTDTTVKIQVKDKISDLAMEEGDHVVLYYNPSREIFVVTAEIASVDRKDPLEITINVSKIEKLKDMAKEKKHCVSFPATIKIIGVPEGKFATVKNISFGGVKVNCKEDIMMEDVVDVIVLLDKINKMPFKGRIVRKNKLNNCFEYGIEYVEMVETSNKLLTRLIFDFENKI